MSIPRRAAWRVALIDSCGEWPGAAAAAAFVSEGGNVERRAGAPDPTGHGSRIARLLMGRGDGAPCELVLAQVFVKSAPATAAALAAAVDWALAVEAGLLHLSVGLAADREVLAAAVRRAVDAGRIVVASMPARGAPVYPAAYAGVIRATGDARCAPGEISALEPRLFGGCPWLDAAERGAAAGGGAANKVDAAGGATGGATGGAAGGASIGAAWVTRHIVMGSRRDHAGVLSDLSVAAKYRGREQRRAM